MVSFYTMSTGANKRATSRAGECWSGGEVGTRRKNEKIQNTNYYLTVSTCGIECTSSIMSSMINCRYTHGPTHTHSSRWTNVDGISHSAKPKICRIQRCNHLPLNDVLEIPVGEIEIVVVEKLYDFAHCDYFPAQRQQLELRWWAK